jgi:hypothetical protein
MNESIDYGDIDYEDKETTESVPGEVSVTETILVYVPGAVGGKWVTSDPDDDDQESVTFSKDIHLAFEFTDIEHAKRSKYLIETEFNIESLVMVESK